MRKPEQTQSKAETSFNALKEISKKLINKGEAMNNPKQIRAAMQLSGIDARILAKHAGVSTHSVYKTIKGTRHNRKAQEAIDELLGPVIAELQEINKATYWRLLSLRKAIA